MNPLPPFANILLHQFFIQAIQPKNKLTPLLIPIFQDLQTQILPTLYVLLSSHCLSQIHILALVTETIFLWVFLPLILLRIQSMI